MTKSTLSLMTAALVVGLGVGVTRAADKDVNEEFNARVHAVNDAAKKKDMMPVALHAVSVETGVPLPEVEAMHKRYSDIGPAGVLIACVMADETKMKPEEFLHERNGGKGWTTMARDHKVPIEKLNARLEHLEKELNRGETREKKHKQ